VRTPRHVAGLQRVLLPCTALLCNSRSMLHAEHASVAVPLHASWLPLVPVPASLVAGSLRLLLFRPVSDDPWLCARPGMSTFSTKGGLYERAQRRYGVSDGKKLFTYTFFEKQRLPALVRQYIPAMPGRSLTSCHAPRILDPSHSL